MIVALKAFPHTDHCVTLLLTSTAHTDAVKYHNKRVKVEKGEMVDSIRAECVSDFHMLLDTLSLIVACARGKTKCS